MTNPVLTCIADRRSIRAYQEVQPTEAQINTLLEAAGQAPSARNLQPWHISVVKNQEIIKEINAETVKQREIEYTDMFYGAPVVFFISVDHPNNRWARLDCGIMVQTIALAAHSMGLGSVILGNPDHAFTGSDGARMNALIKVPEGYTFAVAIAIGVPATTKEAHPVLPDRITFID